LVFVKNPEAVAIESASQGAGSWELQGELGSSGVTGFSKNKNYRTFTTVVVVEQPPSDRAMKMCPYMSTRREAF
jgi:hypothetical protein